MKTAATIWVLILGPLVVSAAPPCDLTGTVVVSSELTTTYCIRTGSTPAWNVGSPLFLSPSADSEGAIYIPYDLSDAWRELDLMLPSSFKTDVGAKLADDCRNHSGVVPDTFYDLHAQLWFYLQEKWMSQGSSRFRDYLGILLGIPPRKLLKPTMQGALTGVVLCTYYSSVRAGDYPDVVEWIDRARGLTRSDVASSPY